EKTRPGESRATVRGAGRAGGLASREYAAAAIAAATAPSTASPIAVRRRRCRRRASLMTPQSTSTDAIGATLDSTMLPVKIDRRDPTPLHEQVAAEIRRAIA